MRLIKNGEKFFMEDNLYHELQKVTVKRMKERDNNKIFLVCGDTGIGKSAFAFQCSSIVDPKFGLKNICFITEEVKKAIRELNNQVVVFDEAFRGISGRSVMNRQQKELLQMLYEIRQLNQVIFLVSPSFFRLDEAIAVELSDALFYVHKTKKGARAFRMFNRKKKDTLYYRAKKIKKSYALVPTMFNGTFPKTYIVNEEEYRAKKFASLYGKDEGEKKKERLNREPYLIAGLVKETGSFRKAKKLLEAAGMHIALSTMHEKVTEIPELHSFVRSKHNYS